VANWTRSTRDFTVIIQNARRTEPSYANTSYTTQLTSKHRSHYEEKEKKHEQSQQTHTHKTKQTETYQQKSLKKFLNAKQRIHNWLNNETAKL